MLSIFRNPGEVDAGRQIRRLSKVRWIRVGADDLLRLRFPERAVVSAQRCAAHRVARRVGKAAEGASLGDAIGGAGPGYYLSPPGSAGCVISGEVVLSIIGTTLAGAGERNRS